MTSVSDLCRKYGVSVWDEEIKRTLHHATSCQAPCTGPEHTVSANILKAVKGRHADIC